MAGRERSTSASTPARRRAIPAARPDTAADRGGFSGDGFSGGGFSGFGADLASFFAELEDHNNREWWQANKARYSDVVGEPLRALASELEPVFGPVKVFRPYRDVRFSADKRPLQEHASLAAGSEGPVLYLQVSADGLYLAGGYYQPARPQLDAFRALLDRPQSAAGVHDVLEGLQAQGFTLHDEGALKSAPRGYSRDHPEIELLRQVHLAVGHRFAPATWLARREALDRVVEGWHVIETWNAWLRDHLPVPTSRTGP